MQIIACATLLSACSHHAQPVASTLPNSLPVELSSTFEKSEVVQRLRIVELSAEWDPSDVHEINMMKQSSLEAPSEFYKRLCKKLTAVKFTTLIEVALPHGVSRPKGNISMENHLVKFNADAADKGNDIWEIGFAVEPNPPVTSNDLTRTLKTRVLIESGSVISIGGQTGTPPGATSRSKTIKYFMEVSPSSIILPTSAATGA